MVNISIECCFWILTLHGPIGIYTPGCTDKLSYLANMRYSICLHSLVCCMTHNIQKIHYYLPWRWYKVLVIGCHLLQRVESPWAANDFHIPNGCAYNIRICRTRLTDWFPLHLKNTSLFLAQ